MTNHPNRSKWSRDTDTAAAREIIAHNERVTSAKSALLSGIEAHLRSLLTAHPDARVARHTMQGGFYVECWRDGHADLHQVADPVRAPDLPAAHTTEIDRGHGVAHASGALKITEALTSTGLDGIPVMTAA